MAPSKKKTGPDDRFNAIQTDPRFKLPKKKSIRGEVDSRFKDALANDERFAVRARVDKYGRKVKSKDVKEELSRYYNLDEDSASEGSSSGNDSDSDSDAETHEEPKQKSKAERKPKPSMRELIRGEGLDESSSSSDASDSDSDSDSDSESDSSVESDLKPSDIDEYERIRAAASAIPQGEETSRLAVVNLDWDNVDSTDLMATFSSFVPANRRIKSVKIYPSEYGKKQMALEELNGPPADLFPESEQDSKTKSHREANQIYDDNKDYSSSRLRKYQLQRLQYYYAVVECDSVATSASIYKNCDGTEYESTANFFDLRFIPEDVDFSSDKPRDECYKVPASYQPKVFTTDALQHSKVKLTWDETPKERERVAQKAFNAKDAEDEDVRAYLASDSDSEEDEESIAQRYRALIQGTSSAETTGDMKPGSESKDAIEITFNPVLEGKQAQLEIIEEKDDKEEVDDNLSTIERYRLKEKQRRLRRMENYKARKSAEQEAEDKNSSTKQAELELLALDDDILTSAATPAEEQKDTKSGKKPKKLTQRAQKKRAQEAAEQDFDTSDPRFQALFEDPDFAIDSTLPQFKKTKGMEKIVGERRKRQESHDDHESATRPASAKKSKRNNEDSAQSARQLALKLRKKVQNLD